MNKWIDISGKELYNQFNSKDNLGGWFKDYVRGFDLKEGEDYEKVWGFVEGTTSPAIVDIKLNYKAYLVITSGCRNREVRLESLDTAGITLGDLDRMLQSGPAMTSLELAERAGKSHKNILRDIRSETGGIRRELENELSLEEMGFYPSTYKTVQGKELPCYLLSDRAVLQMAARYDEGVRYLIIEENYKLRAQLASYILEVKLAQDKDKGHLYVIRNTETGRCKIGFSKSPEKRLKDLQTGADALLEIAYQTPEVLAPKGVERILHDKSAERRAVGEWFNVTLDDIQPELLSLPLEIA